MTTSITDNFKILFTMDIFFYILRTYLYLKNTNCINIGYYILTSKTNSYHIVVNIYKIRRYLKRQLAYPYDKINKDGCLNKIKLHYCETASCLKADSFMIHQTKQNQADVKNFSLMSKSTPDRKFFLYATRQNRRCVALTPFIDLHIWMKAIWWRKITSAASVKSINVKLL